MEGGKVYVDRGTVEETAAEEGHTEFLDAPEAQERWWCHMRGATAGIAK